jgi:hypothetical protein
VDLHVVVEEAQQNEVHPAQGFPSLVVVADLSEVNEVAWHWRYITSLKATIARLPELS